MSKTTLKIMAKVRRKLARIIQLENAHCGHEGLVVKADYARTELLGFIAKELEVWVKKGGGE